jgi:hypothetical protein
VTYKIVDGREVEIRLPANFRPPYVEPDALGELDTWAMSQAGRWRWCANCCVAIRADRFEQHLTDVAHPEGSR